MIEVELRGYFQTALKRNNFVEFLQKNAEVVKDRKQLTTFIEFDHPSLGSLDDSKGSISISIEQDNKTSVERGKVKFKSGSFDSVSRKETSFSFQPSEISGVLNFLSSLGIDRGCPRYYDRLDFQYDQFKITVKTGGLAPDHFEIELEVETTKEVGEAEKGIRQLAESFGLQVATQEEYSHTMKKVFLENPPVPLSEITLPWA